MKIFERQDWALFRTVEGLSHKAGVAPHKLTRLVVKEVADNSLDEAEKASVGALPDGSGYFVEDGGGGIDGTPADIARLFSISRPLISTKLLRLPTRGALGNGLRMVAGVVLASGGKLTVITRNRRIELAPQYDGTTKVVSTTEVDFPTGTRIEISFGPALPTDSRVLHWAQLACLFTQGKAYAGRSSPWWYDEAQFHELLLACGATPVRELVATLDGCTGGTAGMIVATAKLNRAVCNTITREQATALLEAARRQAKPVTPQRLGAIGPDAFPNCAYAVATGDAAVDAGTRRKPVADYVRERRDGERFEEWLQSHRVELNAMTTPEFIAWLDGKMAGYEKLIPPDDVLEAELDARVEEKVRKSVTERILREANADAQVAATIAAITTPDATALTDGVKKLFESEPAAAWRDHVESVATELASAEDESEADS